MDDRHVDTPFGLGQRWTVPHTPAWRRILWIVLGLVLVLVIVWVATRGTTTTRSGRIGAGGPVPVGVSRVVAGDIRVTVDGLGAVTPLATVTVHPQVTGYLNRFDITEGQMVKAGQLLAEIDPRPFQATLDQTKGQLARDEATLANAKIDLGRYEALWKQNAVSQQVLQTQIAAVGTDTGTVKADQAAVESAAINLGFTRIISPVAGRVGLRQVDPGNLVVNSSTSIIVVTELQPISVLFSLPEDSINQVMQQVNAGQKLAATAYDRSMTTKLSDGTLSNVDNQIDQTTGMVKMRAMFDQSGPQALPGAVRQHPAPAQHDAQSNLRAGSRDPARRTGHLRLCGRQGPHGQYAHRHDGTDRRRQGRHHGRRSTGRNGRGRRNRSPQGRRDRAVAGR